MAYNYTTGDGDRIFAPLFADVWETHLKNMNGSDVKVYIALLLHTTQHDRTWFMSIEELAEDAGVGRSTAAAAKDRLIEEGLFVQGWRYRDESGAYHLTDTRPPPRLQGKNVYKVNVRAQRAEPENRIHDVDRVQESDSIESRNRTLVESENRKQTITPSPKPPTEPQPPLTPTGEDGASAAGAEPAPAVEQFDEWWKHVDKKEAKGDARKAFKAALKKVDLDTLIAGIQRSQEHWKRLGRARDKTPHPATWLRAESWEDEYGPTPGGQGSAGRRLSPEEIFLNDLRANAHNPNTSGQSWLDVNGYTPKGIAQ